MKNKTKILTTGLLALTLGVCGSGSSSSNGGSDVNTGVFLDSAVKGLTYKTNTKGISIARVLQTIDFNNNLDDGIIDISYITEETIEYANQGGALGNTNPDIAFLICENGGSAISSVLTYAKGTYSVKNYNVIGDDKVIGIQLNFAELFFNATSNTYYFVIKPDGNLLIPNDSQINEIAENYRISGVPLTSNLWAYKEAIVGKFHYS